MVNTEIRLIIFFAAKDGELLYSQHKQDWELTKILIAKFRLKLKKVGKTTRLFRYEISQIPYDYTVEEVRDIVQETGIKTIPMEKKCKKAKWLSGEALQIGMKRSEKKRRKGKI